MSQLGLEHLKGTALTSWTEDSELNEESGAPAEHELYFPFKYDKFQLRTLTILKNKASVIQGPPGTGKSETIANLLCHLAAKWEESSLRKSKSTSIEGSQRQVTRAQSQILVWIHPEPSLLSTKRAR